MQQRGGFGNDGGDRSRIAPHPIAERDEIGAGFDQRRDFRRIGGEADARRFEHFRPPADAVFDRTEGRALAVLIGLAEHHVIGARFGRAHGVMARFQSSGAGDPVRLEPANRFAKFGKTSQMSAIGAGARHQVGMAIEQQRDVTLLHDTADFLGAVDQRALVARRQAQQHRGDIAGRQSRGKLRRKRRRVRDWRRD